MSFWQRWSEQKLAPQTQGTHNPSADAPVDAQPFELPAENLMAFWQSCEPEAPPTAYQWQPLTSEECQLSRHWLATTHEDNHHG